MARRGENIYHRKDGRWEGRYKNGMWKDIDFDGNSIVINRSVQRIRIDNFDKKHW